MFPADASSWMFKKTPPRTHIRSARMTNGYRAIGRWRGDVVLRFIIGSHADYEKLLGRESG